MFPHTLTVYNVETRTDPATMQTVQTNHITVLRGVLVDPVRASSVVRDGYHGADQVTVYIPFHVAAADGITGAESTYTPPKSYAQAEDKAGLWTLTTDAKTFFIKGEVVEPALTRQQLEQAHEVYSVTNVAERDFGPDDMKHWEIGGA